MQNSNSRSAANKVFPRSLRAETRNRAKDELKRVINATEKVRKWERRWVLLKDSSINVYKWVPVAGQPSIITPKPPQVAKVATVAGDETNPSLISAENSNDETNVTAVSRVNEDSNAAFSEVGFDSDSNQTGTFDRVDYKPEACDESSIAKQTDFSELVREEAASRHLKSNGSDSTPNVRKRPAANSTVTEGSGEASLSLSRKSSRH